MNRANQALASVLVTGVVLMGSGCTGMKSYWQRHHRAHYTIMPEFYAEAPQSIAVLPVTPRYRSGGRREAAKAGAAALREAFYRHVSVKSFEDMEMRDIDGALKQHGLLEDTRSPGDPSYAKKITGALKQVDILGITSLIDPRNYERELGLPKAGGLGEKRFEKEKTQALKKLVPADAFVFGTAKEFGWLYALVLSYVRVEGKVQMRSADTGKLLWKGRGRRTSFAWIVASAFEIPLKVVKVYLNAHAQTLDTATDTLFRDMTQSLRMQDTPVELKARSTCKTPVFKEIGYSYCFWSDYGKIPRGRCMDFLMERDGWYKVATDVKGRRVEGWVFGECAELVDAKDTSRVVRPSLKVGDSFLH